MARSLAPYRSKRDPRRTPEPMHGHRSGPRHEPVFVIQEHHARSLHWDFRLEHDGVLVSWALPKGLPLEPSRNHLAVHTEDHPLDYQDFEGVIPQGEYGGGTVTIWDHGSYELEKWRSDEVMVVLRGDRARGRYVLFRTGPAGGNRWMIHRMDPAPDGTGPPPKAIAPMLAVAGELPARRTGWAYEFKWDGVRAIVSSDGGRSRATSRNGKDLTVSFPEIRDVGAFLGARSVVVDGEIVTFDERGRPDFGRLQHRLHVTSASAASRLAGATPASFLAFDLLHLDGRSTLELPYDERRALLEGLHLEGPTFGTPPSVTDRPGRELFELSRKRGLEGLVVKRRDSPYAPGRRNGAWIKVKHVRTQEVVVGGWTEGKGSRSGGIGALLLGIPAADGLTYVGKVGTGFDEDARTELLHRLGRLERVRSPFDGSVPRGDGHPHFVTPDLVGEVRYTEWTGDGHLRHPSWRGLRPDKRPDEVVRE